MWPNTRTSPAVRSAAATRSSTPSTTGRIVGIVSTHAVPSTCAKCMNDGSMNERAVAEVSGVTRFEPNVTAMNMSPMSVAAAPPVSR